MVEDVLVLFNKVLETLVMSLNPCCGGRCSSTKIQKVTPLTLQVLILVVVEDVLVPAKQIADATNQRS